MHRLKELRKTRELNQEDVANEIGVALVTVQKWEQGKIDIEGMTVKNANKLAKLFDVSIEYLMGWSDK